MKYVKISLLIKSNDRPPYFIGSQLRGALGYALKKVTCINPSYECKDCFSAENCLYYEFYEEKNKAHNYRFDFSLGKAFYECDFYLYEHACEKLPYIVSAFHMMITQNGLGKEKKTYNDFDMYINDQNCLESGSIKIPKNAMQQFEIKKRSSDVKIHLITPLRIKKKNIFIRDDSIELADIVNSIYQRQMQLLGRKYKRFPYPVEGQIIEKKIKYQELTRQSNRQNTKMNLGGIMGVIDLKGLNQETYNILKLGELIGVGKSTVFGLGKINIEENNYV